MKVFQTDLVMVAGGQQVVVTTLTNRSERKSANYFRKSVYGPGGLYTVASARDRTDFFCISDSVTLSRSISN